MNSPDSQEIRKDAYGREPTLMIWHSSKFPSSSHKSGITVHLNGYMCLIVSTPRWPTNSVSFLALEPIVQIVTIASASPFLLIRMMLAPPYSCCNSSDPLSPHFVFSSSGRSSRRSFIPFALSDLMKARG